MALLLPLAACTSSPEGPLRRIGRVKVGVAYGVALEGDFAYVTNNDGVVLVDVSDPAEPRRTAMLELEDGAFGIRAAGDIAYIAADSEGFVTADVSDPRNPARPVQAGRFRFGAGAGRQARLPQLQLPHASHSRH
jgi:hypothetical protein